MHDTRRFVLVAVAVMMTAVLPCVVRGQENNQATPDLTGTGKAHYVPLWKSSTALTDSVIYATGGEVGIGTTTPSATLEVNGDAQVDGNFSLSGSILENGVGQLLWAPNDGSSNFSTGLAALTSTTTGTGNTAVGDGGLESNTTGRNNTAVGNDALRFNTTGGINTAVGYGALQSNTTGGNNTATGGYALYLNTTGSANIATGSGALQNNTSGSGNTAFGYQSL
jgi:trimeric autotransporter adhesin